MASVAVAVGAFDVAAQQCQLSPIPWADLFGDERGDALDPGGGVLERPDVDGVPAGAQTGRHPDVAVDERAGLEEVVGEHGGGRHRVARVLDGLGDAPMQVESAGAAEPGADRLADERVGHPEPSGAVLDEEPGGHGRVRRVQELVAVEPGRVDEDRQGRRVARHGGDVEDLHDMGVEAVEAQPDHRPDRLGQLVADGAVGVADQLGEEERVAAGRRLEVGGGGHVAVVHPQQLHDRRRPEGADRHPGEEPVAGELRGDPIELRARVVRGDADRRDDHHPAGQLVAEDVLDHLQRRRVRPLQVVEHDQHGVHRRLGPQQLGDRLEQQVALDARVGPLEASLRDETLELGHQEGEEAALGGDPAAGLGGDGAQDGPHRLHHRLERHDRLRRRSAPQDDGARGVRLGGELGGEPRLACAGLPVEERQVAGAGQGQRPDPAQLVELLAAADELASRGTRGRARQRDG